jgi:hypothetical protein
MKAGVGVGKDFCDDFDSILQLEPTRHVLEEGRGEGEQPETCALNGFLFTVPPHALHCHHPHSQPFDSMSGLSTRFLSIPDNLHPNWPYRQSGYFHGPSPSGSRMRSYGDYLLHGFREDVMRSLRHILDQCRFHFPPPVQTEGPPSHDAGDVECDEEAVGSSYLQRVLDVLDAARSHVLGLMHQRRPATVDSAPFPGEQASNKESGPGLAREHNVGWLLFGHPIAAPFPSKPAKMEHDEHMDMGSDAGLFLGNGDAIFSAPPPPTAVTEPSSVQEASNDDDDATSWVIPQLGQDALSGWQ